MQRQKNPKGTVRVPERRNAGLFGACTSVFGHRSSLTAGKLRRLAATGIACVEIAALQEQHLCIYDGGRIDELSAAVEELPLKVWAFHAPFCGLAMDDPETRADAVRRLIRAGIVAARLGAGILVVHPGRDVRSLKRDREIAWIRGGLARAVEELPASVAVAMETMGGNSVGGRAEEMRAILDGFDPARAGVCLDTGHLNVGGDPVAFARVLDGRILTVHLHDNGGERDAHALPGDGTIDWPPVLTAIREAGYRGPWISEASCAGMTAESTVRCFIERMALRIPQT